MKTDKISLYYNWLKVKNWLKAIHKKVTLRPELLFCCALQCIWASVVMRVIGFPVVLSLSPVIMFIVALIVCIIVMVRTK